ncbi:hypothetical protein BN903_12 [Halorubrum sp. AJ67]|nr:hypothetical protein BN903_12 [Halorubrum sp. AJ67]
MVVFRVFARGGLAHAVRLPEREVRRVALLGALVRFALRFERVGLLVRELPVPVEARHVEVDGAVRLVGVPLFDQRLHEVEYLRDVLGDAGVHLGAQQVQPAHRVEDARGERLGHVALFGPVVALADTGRDLLVDVGDVLDVTHVVADVFEPPMEDIGVEPQPGVTEVGVVRHRQSTDVQRDVAVGRELDALVFQGVGNDETHYEVVARVSVSNRRIKQTEAGCSPDLFIQKLRGRVSSRLGPLRIRAPSR